VDSERELARIHRVSLMTARHALATLEKEGSVERRRGAGTFVAQPKIHFNKLMSYTEQMASRGLAAGSRLLCNRIVDDAPDIAARLALPLLEKSSRVVILAAPKASSRSFDPSRLQSYYAARGVKAEIDLLPDSGDAAPVLLYAARKAEAQVLVAGAFGHPRLQEFIFGGTTRTLLNSDQPSLFLSH